MVRPAVIARIVPIARVIPVSRVVPVATDFPVIYGCTGRAVAYTVVMVTIVSAVPSVTHSEMVGVVMVDVDVATTVIPSTSSYTMPCMSSTIAGVEYRTTIVEVVTVRIAGIDTEVPVAVCPVEGTIEIGGGTESTQLPVEQDIAQVEVTTLPVNAVYIIITGDTHQVVEVNLISSLILLFCQVQLVSHLVREEKSLVASLLVAHCLARCCECQHCYQGDHHLLHILIIFYQFNKMLLFTMQR